MGSAVLAVSKGAFLVTELQATENPRGGEEPLPYFLR